MSASTLRPSLYRTAGRFVILAVTALSLARSMPGQTARGAQTSKGPRALGLLELAPDGKATLIPITILIDGQYFDAGAYKASPVPIALWSETVYEGVRTGVSQGLFTIRGALENEATHQWKAEGTWQPAGSVPAKSGKEPASLVPRGMNQDEGPPVLRHAGAATPKVPGPAATPPAPPVPPSPATVTPPAAAPKPTSPPAPPAPPSPPAAAQGQEDQGPVLRRGKPVPKPPEPLVAPAMPSKAGAHPPTRSVPAHVTQIQLIPAISDAGGPDPRPYAYSLKPEEEQQFRKKMLELAADAVRARAKQLASQAIGQPEPSGMPSRKKAPARPAQPSFEDVQLHVFDLSNSNEPVLVLTAKGQMPPSAGEQQSMSPDLRYFVTLVARQDINADFHRAFSNVADSQHLDVLSQVEFIDAVDVDGDGRGELLFRQVSDAGSAFVVYRVIGDQLYALFQGTP